MFLVGLQHYRAQSQAEGDTDYDSKKSDPHDGLLRWRGLRAREVWPKQRARLCLVPHFFSR